MANKNEYGTIVVTETGVLDSNDSNDENSILFSAVTNKNNNPTQNQNNINSSSKSEGECLCENEIPSSSTDLKLEKNRNCRRCI